MNFIERVMRVMTHINIGATLGLAAWVLWSGWQVATGQMTPAYSVADVKALMSLAQASEPVALQLVPIQASGLQPPCHLAAPSVPSAERAPLTLSGADL